MIRPLYAKRKNTLYPFTIGWLDSQSRYGHDGEEKNTSAGNRNPVIGPVAQLIYYLHVADHSTLKWETLKIYDDTESIMKVNLYGPEWKWKMVIKGE
jgi:hypothetical protein